MLRRTTLCLALCAASAWPLAAAAADDLQPRNLPRYILLDQKAIWTSPFHMTRHSASWWLGLGAATAALIATDHQSSGALPVTGASPRAGTDLSRLGATWSVASFAGGFYAIGLATGNAKARDTGFLATEALLDSAIVVQALKYSTGRARPVSPDAGKFFHGGVSFPSGHSIAAWSLASVVAHKYGNRKYVPVLAYGLAAVVGGARFTARAHYASDVVAGGAMGYFIGRYVYQTHQPAHDSRAFSVTPILDPAHRSYGVSARIGL